VRHPIPDDVAGRAVIDHQGDERALGGVRLAISPAQRRGTRTGSRRCLAPTPSARRPSACSSLVTLAV
jgi:hypothetical protein